MSGGSIYLEHHDGRIYEVVTVPDYPRTRHGKLCRCRLIEHEQRIEIAAFVPSAERPRLLAIALGLEVTDDVVWRLVPQSVKHVPQAPEPA